jgi:membrane protein
MAVTAQPAPSRLAVVKDLATKTFANFSEDNVPRLAAAFSFYAVLSLAPLLVLAVVIASAVLGEGGARESVLSQAQGLLGKEGRSLVEGFLESSSGKGTGIIATISSLVVTFFSASNLFLQLMDAVNAMWGIKQTGPMFKNLILSRIGAFLAVLVFGAIVLGWVALDSWLHWIERHTTGFTGWPVVSAVVSVLFLTGVFAVSFKKLPAGHLAWHDVWLPAFITAVLVAIAKAVLGFYFARAGGAGAPGVAGALVVVLLWIYYTSQIFFFGFELTYTYAHNYGSRQEKNENHPTVQFS